MAVVATVAMAEVVAMEEVGRAAASAVDLVVED